MTKKAAATKKPAAKEALAARRRALPAGELARLRRRFGRILAGLRGLYPDATCALNHDSALSLLIAVILSAQSTDETVNRITPLLFAKYPTARDLAEAKPADVEKVVYPTGFFRQKTKSIQGACKTIVERFAGNVPDTMDELLTLPGVARKTANVVLGTWFHKNEGVVVDTHVGRLAHRLGLTWSSKDSKDAGKIEEDLMQVIPRDAWTFAGHALIWHGRRVCSARKPDCAECRLSSDCPSAFTFESAPGKVSGQRRKTARSTRAGS
jgi:endonuclease-3